MVEMRFYIPGTTTRKEAEGGDAGSDADEEEKNAVMLFYDTLMEKADIGETAGDTIATFLDVLHLTPRFVPLADRSETWLLTPPQRSLRHRHVRFLVPPARQDVRLQDPVRAHQKVHRPPKARRHALYALYWTGPAPPPRSDSVPVPRHAVQGRRGGHSGSQHHRGGARGQIQGQARGTLRAAAAPGRHVHLQGTRQQEGDGSRQGLYHVRAHFGPTPLPTCSC